MNTEDYAKRQLDEAKSHSDYMRNTNAILQDIHNELKTMNNILERNTGLILDMLGLWKSFSFTE